MKTMAAGLFCVFLAACVCRAAGIRINTSASIPRGFYRISNSVISRGRYVLVCPPNSALFAEAKARAYIGAGVCPGNLGYLMKRVHGEPGDKVAIHVDGVWVNGARLPNSAQRPGDGLGRPLPAPLLDNVVLRDGRYLLMSDSRNSFDARYFGAVERRQIVAVIEPLWTWGGA